MAKRRISKASKRRLSFFSPLCIIAIFYSVFSLLYNGYTVYELTMQKNKLEKKLISLQEKAEELKTDIEKLNDDEYLANYAREHYLYSKDGEYIIHIEDEDVEDTIVNIDKEINKNYIVIAITIISFLAIIFILKKLKKK